MLLIRAVLSSSEDGAALPAMSSKPASKCSWCLNSDFCSALVMIALFYQINWLWSHLGDTARVSVWVCKALIEERRPILIAGSVILWPGNPGWRKRDRGLVRYLSGKSASQVQRLELVPWNPCESGRRKLSSETSDLHVCTVARMPTTHIYNTHKTQLPGWSCWEGSTPHSSNFPHSDGLLWDWEPK